MADNNIKSLLDIAETSQSSHIIYPCCSIRYILCVIRKKYGDLFLDNWMETSEQVNVAIMPHTSI
jgi:hypothetical protein